MENDNRIEGQGWVEESLQTLRPPEDWQPNTSRAFALLQQQGKAESSRGWRWTWIVAGIALTSVSLAAFPSTRAFAGRCVSVCASESSKAVQFVMASFGKQAATSIVERKAAPDFTLTDADGKPVKLSNFHGKVVLLNFWATWCLPCVKEIPWFIEFQSKNPDLVVLGISLDDEGWKVVKPYMQGRAINYRIALGTDEVVARYEGVPMLPTSYLVDKSGQIAVTHTGLCGKADYESEIKKLLNE